MFSKFSRWRVAFCLVGMLALSAVIAPVSVSAKTQKLTHTTSYVVTDSDGASRATASSPCSSAGCANGIRFQWSSGACVSGDHFVPIVVVFTVNHKIPSNSWPMVVPCSTGIQLTWDTHNHLTKANWTGSSDASYGLAVCFPAGKRCSKSICVTNGCLPQNTDGVDIFFQGGGALQGAAWLKNGKSVGSIAGSASDDVYWYGHTPPASPFARRTHSAHPSVARAALSQPKVVLLGRTASKTPQTTTSVAPAGAYAVSFKWFLAPSSAQKQCIVEGGIAWTNPPMAFEYTSQGVLNSRVSVLQCALAATGAPDFFNGINFSFQPGATSYNVLSAAPTFNGLALTGIQPGLIPQPPAGTDGIVFAFHHDNYVGTSWVPYPALLPAPGHPRMATWVG